VLFIIWYHDTMLPFLTKVTEHALDMLFPPICLLCSAALAGEEKTRALCENCFSRIPISSALTCPVCRARLAANTKTCHKDASYRLAAAASYDHEPVKSLIWQLKYERRTAAARPLADCLVRHLSSLPVNLTGYELISMPLHPSRERERGFNQAELIAREISRSRGFPLVRGAFARIRNTPSQAESRGREERAQNVAGCFAARKPERIAENRILLIDDVFTSGATINEAVRALRAAGAYRVVAAVVAKA
jgi:competence protein ComFC